MEDGNLLKVRLKYFGTFQVYDGRARAMLGRLKEQFDKKKIEPSEYFRIKKMLETYLQEKENESKD
tara:strand:- start:10857 stop:11054 length:198 start_codon:yes stop_codon:yes gene_type:complete